jgi:hypothetical protein
VFAFVDALLNVIVAGVTVPPDIVKSAIGSGVGATGLSSSLEQPANVRMESEKRRAQKRKDRNIFSTSR